MENWLKGLIAAACIVVIGAGSFTAWSHYNDWRLARDAEQNQASLRHKERCAAYRDNPRPFNDESEALADLTKRACADEFPDLY